MSTYTKNINLYEADTSTDGDDTFNIDTMLNDNWDKIDDAIAIINANNTVVSIDAYQQYTDNKIELLMGNVILGLNTLEKISNAINNDPNYNTNILLALSKKSNSIDVTALQTTINLQLATKANTVDLTNLQTSINLQLLNKANSIDVTTLQSNVNSQITAFQNAVNLQLSTVATSTTLTAFETSINTQVAGKANLVDLTSFQTYVNTQLILKSNVTDVNSGLALKANTIDLTSFQTTTNAQLALKSNITDMNSGLALKANSIDVANSLSLLANANDVMNSLSLKDDIVNVDNKLALKANITDVVNKLNLKANESDLSDLQTSVANLFQSANDGKTAVAAAITARGVAATNADTFSALATKVGQISSGKYAVGDFLSCAAVGTTATSTLVWGPYSQSEPKYAELYYVSGTIIAAYRYGNGLQGYASANVIGWTQQISGSSPSTGTPSFGKGTVKDGFLYNTIQFYDQVTSASKIDILKINSSGTQVIRKNVANYGITFATSDDAYIYVLNTIYGTSITLSKADTNTLGLVASITCLLPVSVGGGLSAAVDYAGNIYISMCLNQTYIWKFNPTGGSPIAIYTGVTSSSYQGSMIIHSNLLYLIDSAGKFNVIDLSLKVISTYANAIENCSISITPDGLIQAGNYIFKPDGTWINTLPSGYNILQTSKTAAFGIAVTPGSSGWINDTGYNFVTGYIING